MISYLEALKILKETSEQLPKAEVNVPLTESLGSVLASDIYGREDIPHFNNSAMDGFAICAESSLNASLDKPVRLVIESSIAAGDTSTNSKILNSHIAVEIMTGAPIPEGCLDAVIRVEDTKVEIKDGKKEVLLFKKVNPGENIRAKASDFRANDLIAKKGTVIDSEYLLALASQGISSVCVRKRLKVAILSTGKELRSIEQNRSSSSQIWNSSGPYLSSILEELGCEVINFGIIEDEPNIFLELINKGLQDGVDVFLSTGAVSMGKHDFVVESLKKIGASVKFHKVAIRPGKPICFAEFAKHEAVFFGLPGNPVSTAIGMKFFINPFLRNLLGVRSEAEIMARLKRDIIKPDLLRCFFKGIVEFGKDGISVEVLERQESYVLSSLIRANCWVELLENHSKYSENIAVRVFPLSNSLKKGVFL